MPALGSTVKVGIEAPPPSGTLVLEVFDSAEGFGDLGGSIHHAEIEASERVDFPMIELPPGSYAIAVYHDANGNGFLDKNFLGIPKEAVGFSNSYRPKGPPNYERASFTLVEDEMRLESIRPVQPLGNFGRIGIGVGVIAKTNSYKGSEGFTFRAIPGVVYIGERVQLIGPRLQVALGGNNMVQAAIVASYRFSAYDEDDSRFLKGLGDRDNTLMGGFAANLNLAWNLSVGLRYEYDLLGRIEGGEGSIELERPFQLGLVHFTPSVGVIWRDENISRYDYGVPDSKTPPERSAYEPGKTLGTVARLGIYWEVTRDLNLLASVGVERLDDDIVDSPIVSDGKVYQYLILISYTF